MLHKVWSWCSSRCAGKQDGIEWCLSGNVSPPTCACLGCPFMEHKTICKGTPKNGPVYHATLSESMHVHRVGPAAIGERGTQMPYSLKFRWISNLLIFCKEVYNSLQNDASGESFCDSVYRSPTCKPLCILHHDAHALWVWMQVDENNVSTQVRSRCLASQGKCTPDACYQAKVPLGVTYKKLVERDIPCYCYTYSYGMMMLFAMLISINDSCANTTPVTERMTEI